VDAQADVDAQAAETARKLWSRGNYPALADRLVPAARSVAVAAGPGQGRSALDVAAGTGSLALALASGGWQASAIDISPRLIEHGRCRSEAAGFDIRWYEACLDNLPFRAESFDLVGSSFGLIFAPDPAEALAETRRVLRPGGVLAFSAWTAGGYIGRMTAVMGELMDATDAMAGPFRWGEPTTTAAWLAGGFTEVGTQRHTLPWVFESAEAVTDYLFQNSPGHLAALELVGDRADELVDAVTEHHRGLAADDGSIDIAAEYVVTVASRAG